MSKTMTRDEKIAKLGKIITDRKEVLLGLEKVTPDAPWRPIASIPPC